MAIRISDLKRNLNEELPATQFVGGFPRKHLSVLASAPGVGKTWFVLKTAMDLSNGGNIFFGLDHHQPVSKTVIFCGEGSVEMLVERARLLEQTYNANKIAIYSLADMVRAGLNPCLDDKDGIALFKKIIAGEEADVVFIDTLIAFRSDDENASKETSRLLSRLAAIAQANNCAIIITHHIRKKARRDTNETTQDDIIGSSAITRLCATAWLLTSDPKTSAKTLACVKSWWEKPPQIEWKIFTTPYKTIALDRTNRPAGQQARKVIRDFLHDCAKETPITLEDIRAQTFVDENSVYMIAEEIQKNGTGNIVETEEGKHAIILFDEKHETTH